MTPKPIVAGNELQEIMLRNDRNDATTRSTIRLRPIDEKRLRHIVSRHNLTTKNKAIWKALELATETPEAKLVDLSYRVLKWADTLLYVCPREQEELRGLSEELYNLVTALKGRDDYSEELETQNVCRTEV